MSSSRDFPGSTNTDRVTVTQAASINDLAPMSICIWINLDAIDTTARRITDKNSGSGDDRHHIYFIRDDGGGDVIEFWAVNWDSGGGTGQWKITAPSTANWHHLVTTYAYSATADNPVMYLNGSSQSVTEDVAPSGTLNLSDATDIQVGNSGGSHNRCFNGKLAYFSYHNSILTAVEAIEAMYYPESVPSGTKCLIPMWGDSTEVDLSGNGNTGSPTGTTAHADGPPVALMQGYAA